MMFVTVMLLYIADRFEQLNNDTETLMLALFSNDDIIVIDVGCEYGSLIRNFGGEVITISASSKTHINTLEINNDIDMDENPVSIKQFDKGISDTYKIYLVTLTYEII